MCEGAPLGAEGRSPSPPPGARPYSCVSCGSVRSTNAISLPSRAHAAPCGHRRDGYPQILAQGFARVRRTEQAAALELGYDEANEVLVGSGNVSRGNDEPVASALDQPLLELITNLFRTTDDRIMHLAATAEVNEVAHRRIFVAARTHDAVADRLEPGDCRHLLVRECFVHFLGREVEIKRF